jgi:hypothetical protein
MATRPMMAVGMLRVAEADVKEIKAPGASLAPAGTVVRQVRAAR